MARVYSDQTGRLPINARNINKYIFLMYDYYANKILTKPLNNCTGQKKSDRLIQTVQLPHREIFSNQN